MRLIVTGADGFIGSRVVQEAAGRGHDVLAWSRSLADLNDGERTRDLLRRFRPEAIVHAAWYTRATDYLRSPENLRCLAATLDLVDASVDAGCGRFVGVGTCFEYADGPNPRRESDAADPQTLYAACKLASWMVGRERARQQHATFVWARPFHVYGPGEHPARLIPSVRAALRAGQTFVASPGNQVRDPVHVADVASGLTTLAERGEQGVYNICLGRPVSLRQTLEAVAAIEGRVDLLQFGGRPYGAGESMFLVGDPGRLRALGWDPRFESLTVGLKDALGAPGEAV